MMELWVFYAPGHQRSVARHCVTPSKGKRWNGGAKVEGQGREKRKWELSESVGLQPCLARAL